MLMSTVPDLFEKLSVLLTTLTGSAPILFLQEQIKTSSSSSSSSVMRAEGGPPRGQCNSCIGFPLGGAITVESGRERGDGDKAEADP